MTHYVVFGDSIVRGGYDPLNGGWVRRLGAYIESKTYGDKVYNCGISGDTSSDLLKRFAVELTARKADVVVIAIGINDSRHDPSLNEPIVDMPTFKSNLQKMFELCSADARVKKIIFVGVTAVNEKRTNPWKGKGSYYNETIKLYDVAVQEFAESKHLLFIPMNDILSNEDLHDGLHPSEQGHTKMYERIVSYF